MAKIPEQFHLLSETYALCVMPTIISSETSWVNSIPSREFGFLN